MPHPLRQFLVTAFSSLLVFTAFNAVYTHPTASFAEATSEDSAIPPQPISYALDEVVSDERVLITAIIDGDTLLARFADGKERQIRLLGINTPEVTTSTYGEQCFGAEATAAVSMALKGGRYVYLKADPINRDEDDFGRKLRYVYFPLSDQSGRFMDLSEYLVSTGHATVFREYPAINKQRYLRQEILAESVRVGMWGSC